ncbi:hypothetical protein BDV95DRAFT_19767 [Massariosphaeria phaeospora]|uniref:Uncharacterized protein n=1 Tax=Massariosphaeria phaeospora TaxID=100035 RepID=A0A7C8IFI0_9PLEO|nr:hypothetical protein BDV95DRAFT_19767 [Massariosphaeria phaeospora]
MSPYQHLFSTNAVLNVWRNLRNNRDQNDLLLTLQYQPDEVRGGARRFGKGTVVETTTEDGGRGRSGAGVVDGRGAMEGGRSIGFVVPWRSMQAQKRELKEKEKELAEALVVLAGEVAFTDLPDGLQSSLSHNPLIQVRHIAAGLSRQMSKIELQMFDNAPFATGKNLYTGGEIARKFLPPIQTLFNQGPVPQRMIFELLLELKDLVYSGMADCDQEVLEWELNNFTSFEDLDECIVQSITPIVSSSTSEPPSSPHRRLKRKPSTLATTPTPTPFLHDTAELLYHLESLETTASTMTHLRIPITDFCAKAAITLRRMLDRRTLNDYALAKKKRAGRCADYARCMKWAGTSWRQGGGCRRGCRNEDEDAAGLPCWHSSSRNFERSGMYVLGGGDDSGRRRIGDEGGVARLGRG